MQTRDGAHFHIVLVKGWIQRGDHFLLAQRSSKELHTPGVWSLPGGKIDAVTDEVSDIMEETLKAEIREEVGLEVEPRALIYTNAFTRVDDATVVNATFLCRYTSGEARPLEDTEAVRWYTLQELMALPDVVDFLRREIEALQNYVERKDL